MLLDHVKTKDQSLPYPKNLLATLGIEPYTNNSLATLSIVFLRNKLRFLRNKLRFLRKVGIYSKIHLNRKRHSKVFIAFFVTIWFLLVHLCVSRFVCFKFAACLPVFISLLGSLSFGVRMILAYLYGDL